MRLQRTINISAIRKLPLGKVREVLVINKFSISRHLDSYRDGVLSPLATSKKCVTKAQTIKQYLNRISGKKKETIWSLN